jgi:hypothetical protein
MVPAMAVSRTGAEEDASLPAEEDAADGNEYYYGRYQ